MPVAKLYVEGDLDVQLLASILGGIPVVQRGGSKSGLRVRAGLERRETGVAAGYLRDRDFDYDPTDAAQEPTLDSTFEGTQTPLGWRWCRHEVENYLIDPLVVCEATGWSHMEFSDGLLQAALRIRSYQSARWTIGLVRRNLPPNHELRTRPSSLNEIALPQGLAAASVYAWASNTISEHREPIVSATTSMAVQQSFQSFEGRFDDAFCEEVEKVLTWFSGKDLLAGLTDWLDHKGVANPGELRATIRNWIIAHPERTLQLLPEWDRLVTLLRE